MISTLTKAAGHYSHQGIPLEFEELCYNTLTVPAKMFLENVRGLPVVDQNILDLALQAYDLARSSACEGKMREVLKALETALLKNKKNLSDGLTYSLCVIASVSKVDAAVLVWRTHRNSEDLKLVDTQLKERESALEALFSLVKPSQKEDRLLCIQQAAGVEVDQGTMGYLPYESLTLLMYFILQRKFGKPVPLSRALAPARRIASIDR